MKADRIKEIQNETAYPNSVSVQQALLKVWNECEQEIPKEGEEKLHTCDYCGYEWTEKTTLSLPTEKRTFPVSEIERLQSAVHKITGDGKVMQLFNELIGNNSA